MPNLTPSGESPLLDSKSRTYVAGHRGLAGSAIWRALEGANFQRLIGRTSSELDLRDREATAQFFTKERPTQVVLAAAKVGGIVANDTFPADFLSENLRIQVNTLDCAAATGTRRLLFLGSSCIYPKFAEQPIREESLLTGALESTNEAYAVAKIAGVLQVQSIRRQFGLPFISAMPTNLYGPGDNFDERSSHVLPALMRRFHHAKSNGMTEVVVWGSGAPRREFLHVDDLASAALFLLENYDDPRPINVGTGHDISIRELAELMASITGYEGDIIFDTSLPDGTPRKLLDVSRLAELGWRARIDLEGGLRETYAWYRHNSGRIREKTYR